MRYDRARTSLDRHATYIVAAYVAGPPVMTGRSAPLRLPRHSGQAEGPGTM